MDNEFVPPANAGNNIKSDNTNTHTHTNTHTNKHTHKQTHTQPHTQTNKSVNYQLTQTFGGFSAQFLSKQFEACIRSVMLYGGETWALTARLEGILLSCDRRMLRYVAEVVEGMTFSLPHIFPNPCFLSISELNYMPLDYRFHLIYHAYCSGMFISHML